jgi:hypothetical protein
MDITRPLTNHIPVATWTAKDHSVVVLAFLNAVFYSHLDVSRNIRQPCIAAEHHHQLSIISALYQAASMLTQLQRTTGSPLLFCGKPTVGSNGKLEDFESVSGVPLHKRSEPCIVLALRPSGAHDIQVAIAETRQCLHIPLITVYLPAEAS